MVKPGKLKVKVDVDGSIKDIGRMRVKKWYDWDEISEEEQEKVKVKSIMSKDATVDVLRKIVTDLKERIEIVHTQEYANFLKYFVSEQ